ncbi:MAG TPA: EamA family transporter RarD [Candidatus Didemnitutus sp.]|nr:EamA family transporter RarD [Candidatus Didemnitutus sp.]
MSSETHTPHQLRGVFAAAGGFLIWGIVPLYWKQMQGVSPFELIAHRVTWSLLLLLGVMALQKSFGELRPAFTNSRTFLLSLASSLLLTANWTVYIWAVNTGHIIESSLGYFLTPLGNVALGFLLLHERLRPLQWTAIAFAALGVGFLLIGVGHVPWIALSLAGTWSSYALLRKRSPLGSLAGLTVETILLLPAAAAFLLWRAHTGEGALGHVSPLLHVYVLSVGIVTAIPLLLFAYGARRLRLATIGLLQYISPTVQFLIGLFIYREPFDSARFQAYALIWCGLVLYSADSFWTQRRTLLKAAGAA